jgi:hypothetical protein
MMIRGEFGLLKVFEGLVLLPYAVILVVAQAVSGNYSHKLMG